LKRNENEGTKADQKNTSVLDNLKGALTNYSPPAQRVSDHNSSRLQDTPIKVIDFAPKTLLTRQNITDTNRPLRVFLCHSSNDKPAVRELYNALKSHEWIDPWLDKMKILPGQNWRMVIEEAVETSDIVIICLSNHSVNKEGFIQREIRYAYDLALEKPDGVIFLIPLRLEECEVPRGVRSFQWVDYFGFEKNEQYSNLLESLKLRLKQKLDFEKK
jgi:hypothetical protein